MEKFYFTSGLVHCIKTDRNKRADDFLVIETLLFPND